MSPSQTLRRTRETGESAELPLIRRSETVRVLVVPYGFEFENPLKVLI
jgi:hypothetical protein